MFQIDFQKIILKTWYRMQFQFNNRFLKQVDDYTMGESLSFSFSDIYLFKMENDIEKLSWRFVDGFYNRKKIRENFLFTQLNNVWMLNLAYN